MRALPVMAQGLHRLSRRLRALVPVGRRHPGPREISALLAEIAACREALGRFGQTSDDEFSALAQGLSQLNTRLAALRSETSRLEAVLQDRDEERAMSSAYSLYKDSVDLVHANAGIAVSAQAQLTEVENSLVQCCRGRETYERDQMFLRIVTLSIRIEASRLPPEAQSVFLNVAAAIAETSERIQSCTTTAFGRIEAVIAESRAARGELNRTEQSLQIRARQSIDTVQRELAALQAALVPCADQSRAIGELLTTAQPQTMAVIGALQHQDIVRQQLDHVSEGFHDLDRHFRGTAAAPTIAWDYVEPAARIQAAQLAASRAEIEAAGATVVDGLQALLATSAAMVERFAAMEETAATALGQCRIAELFSHELHELTGIIAQSQQANARTGRLVERIEEVVRLFSEEIGRHELDVKIVALNAQIAAARLSSADALNKLAEETSQVSDTNARLSHELSANLRANLGRLDQVKRDGATFLDIVTRERTQLERGLGVVVGKLARLVDRVRADSVQARRDFEPVHADCRALLDQLGFPALIETTFGPAARLCARLAAIGAPSAGAAAPSAASREKIARHQHRYTMRKENTTHAAALGASPTGESTAHGADGIELFDATVASRPAPTRFDGPPPVAVTAPDRPSPSPAAASFGDGIELF